MYSQQRQLIDVPVTRIDLDQMSSLDLSEWLTNLSYPPLIELTPESSDLVFSQQRVGFENHFLFLLHNVASDAGQQRLDAVRALGRRMQGKAVVIYIDMSNLSEYCADVLKSLQVSVGEGEVDALHAVVSKTSAMNFYSGVSLDSALEGVSTWMEGVLGDLVKPARTTSHEQ